VGSAVSSDLSLGTTSSKSLNWTWWFRTDASCRTDSEDWSAFDSVLTESGAFLVLHRVFVEIWWYSYGMDDVEENSVLESLKQVKFPRLVESKAVEFNFSAEIHYVSW
jgi:hypothetical protein